MKPSENEIRNAVLDGLKQIAPEAELGALDPTAPIRQTLEIDSFDFLRLLIGLNEDLKIEFPEADYGRLSSLDNLVQYISKKVSESEPNKSSKSG